MKKAVISIADVCERLRKQSQPIHPLDALEPRQITALLLDCGFSPRTAADASEITYAVMASIRLGRPVPPRWGWGDGQ